MYVSSLVSHPPFHLFCANRDIHFTLDLSWPAQMISKLYFYNIPGASQPTLMLLNFIATNEEEALWVSFSDGNGTGAGALFLKKFLKKKLLAHGTLLHFRWTAPKGPMNWIIHVGDWKSQLQHPSLSTPSLHPCDARYTSFATCTTLVSLIKWSNNIVKIERVSSLSFNFKCT